MKKTATYISFFVLLSSLSFAGKSDKASLLSGHAVINFEQSTLTEDDGAVVDRKRAHKRKRRVRPKRNGF